MGTRFSLVRSSLSIDRATFIDGSEEVGRSTAPCRGLLLLDQVSEGSLRGAGRLHGLSRFEQDGHRPFSAHMEIRADSSAVAA